MGGYIEDDFMPHDDCDGSEESELVERFVQQHISPEEQALIQDALKKDVELNIDENERE